MGDSLVGMAVQEGTCGAYDNVSPLCNAEHAQD